MNAKLTLNLNKNTTEEAKIYARRNNVSLSKLIESYLNSLVKPPSTKKKISPLVESLTGIIPNANIEERKEYRDYLTEKYL
ncbi:MAG: DUF6364 family protein [Lentimicrobiaceae bacterium]|nr:DUF6364 family protein [Lentimicrobiaceae bacterium]